MVHANEKTRFVRTVGVLSLAVCLSGCITADTLDRAKARTHTNDTHEVVVEEPARLGYYALLPLSVLADTVLLPVYAVAVIVVNLGITPPP